VCFVFPQPRTPTEEVAIWRALETEISRGHGGDRRTDQVEKIPLEIKSREIAASKAGFGKGVQVGQPTKRETFPNDRDPARLDTCRR